MAVKYVCDNCGIEEGVGRVVLSICISTPLTNAHLPKFDGELCPMCLQRLAATVRDVVTPNRKKVA